MKLMLQEASCIIKAIEKAWESSGKPQEFTIKIIDFEDKNFFGITRKPAVISISYDPRKQTQKVEPKEIKRPGTWVKKDFREQAKEPARKIEPNREPAKQNLPQHSQQTKIAPEGWDQIYVKDVSIWLEDMFKMMGITSTFNVKVEQKILKILLDKRFLKETDEEKMFFISLSYLLMQSLKKKYKKKFKNYYLIIQTNSAKTNGEK